jgi:hypothetical protein
LVVGFGLLEADEEVRSGSFDGTGLGAGVRGAQRPRAGYRGGSPGAGAGMVVVPGGRRAGGCGLGPVRLPFAAVFGA